MTKVGSKPKATGKTLAKQKNVLPSKPAPQKVMKQDKCDKERQPSPKHQSDDPWIASNSTTRKPVAAKTDKAFLSEKPLSPFRFGAASSAVSQSKPFNFSIKLKTSAFVNISRGASKECAPPSPLCFRYKAADDLMNTPQQQDVNEEALPLEDPLATVKRNCFHDPSICDPVVVASQLSKDVKCHDTDSGNAGDDSSDSSDNEQDDKNKGTGHCDNKDSTVEEEKDVSLVPEDSSAAVIAGVSGATPKSLEVQRFKDLHEDTVGLLTKYCKVWERKVDEMSSVAAQDNEDGMCIRGGLGYLFVLLGFSIEFIFTYNGHGMCALFVCHAMQNVDGKNILNFAKTLSVIEYSG